MEEELINIKEASKYLGIAQSTIRTYMQKGFLIPVCRQKGVLGNPSLFRKSDIDNLKNHPAWRGPLVSPTRGRSLYINIADRPKEDEHRDDDCIIHWSERFRNKNHTYVPVTCKICHEKFSKLDEILMRTLKDSTFTGACNKCYPKCRGKIKMRNDGITIRRGYIFRHIRSFTFQEQVILRQMPLNNDIYIPEHRAIMALHLGRPLESTESVHHIDGNKSNNSVENLQIFDSQVHSKLHGQQLIDMLELQRRIEELEKENLVLRQEITKNGNS